MKTSLTRSSWQRIRDHVFGLLGSSSRPFPPRLGNSTKSSFLIRSCANLKSQHIILIWYPVAITENAGIKEVGTGPLVDVRQGAADAERVDGVLQGPARPNPIRSTPRLRSTGLWEEASARRRQAYYRNFKPRQPFVMPTSFYNKPRSPPRRKSTRGKAAKPARFR